MSLENDFKDKSIKTNHTTTQYMLQHCNKDQSIVLSFFGHKRLQSTINIRNENRAKEK